MIARYMTLLDVKVFAKSKQSNGEACLRMPLQAPVTPKISATLLSLATDRLVCLIKIHQLALLSEFLLSSVCIPHFFF